MSQENVEVVQRGFTHFEATGDFLAEVFATDFVWDMSKFRDWPERPAYEGIEGARSFIAEWTGAWDDWRLDVEAFRDAGDKVVVLIRQRGRSKVTGMPVDMHFAQVYTVCEGKQARMEMYADPDEAFKAVGLEE
jgi:ketosteroid isomerase-like protein